MHIKNACPIYFQGRLLAHLLSCKSHKSWAGLTFWMLEGPSLLVFLIHSGLEIENIAKWLGQYPTQEEFWSIKPNIQPFLEDLVHSRIYIVTWVHMYCRIFTKNQGCCCLSYTIEEDRPKDNMQICCFIVTIHLHTIVHLCISFIPSSLSLSLVIWRARFLKHLDCWQDMYIGTSQALGTHFKKFLNKF